MTALNPPKQPEPRARSPRGVEIPVSAKALLRPHRLSINRDSIPPADRKGGSSAVSEKVGPLSSPLAKGGQRGVHADGEEPPPTPPC